MDEDFDIYESLDDVNHITKIKENEEEIQKLTEKCSAALKNYKSLEESNEKLRLANDALTHNISSLLLTAKKELERKDNMISELRKKIDDSAFRRFRKDSNARDKSVVTKLTQTDIHIHPGESDSDKYLRSDLTRPRVGNDNGYTSNDRNKYDKLSTNDNVLQRNNKISKRYPDERREYSSKRGQSSHYHFNGNRSLSRNSRSKSPKYDRKRRRSNRSSSVEKIEYSSYNSKYHIEKETHKRTCHDKEKRGRRDTKIEESKKTYNTENRMLTRSRREEREKWRSSGNSSEKLTQKKDKISGRLTLDRENCNKKANNRTEKSKNAISTKKNKDQHSSLIIIPKVLNEEKKSCMETITDSSTIMIGNQIENNTNYSEQKYSLNETLKNTDGIVNQEIIIQDKLSSRSNQDLKDLSNETENKSTVAITSKKDKENSSIPEISLINDTETISTEKKKSCVETKDDCTAVMTKEEQIESCSNTEECSLTDTDIILRQDIIIHDKNDTEKISTEEKKSCVETKEDCTAIMTKEEQIESCSNTEECSLKDTDIVLDQDIIIHDNPSSRLNLDLEDHNRKICNKIGKKSTEISKKDDQHSSVNIMSEISIEIKKLCVETKKDCTAVMNKQEEIESCSNTEECSLKETGQVKLSSQLNLDLEDHNKKACDQIETNSMDITKKEYGQHSSTIILSDISLLKDIKQISVEEKELCVEINKDFTIVMSKDEEIENSAYTKEDCSLKETSKINSLTNVSSLSTEVEEKKSGNVSRRKINISMGSTDYSIESNDDGVVNVFIKKKKRKLRS